MQAETICYHADGLAMQGRLFVPKGSGPRAGVLVFPEAFGIGAHSIARAEQLAELGYVALACDLHGDGKFLAALPEAMAVLQALFDDPRRTRARAASALDAFAARPEVDASRIAAIGFCFPMPLELARSGAKLKATIGFHTGLATKLPARVGAVHGAMLVSVGGDDPFITAADRAGFEAEMRAAGADWRIDVYGGTVHSFTNRDAGQQNRPDAIRYSAIAERRAWATATDLLAECLA